MPYVIDLATGLPIVWLTVVLYVLVGGLVALYGAKLVCMLRK